MTTEFPQVLTPEEVAEKLRCSTVGIVAELEAGRMRGFRVAGEWRLTTDDVLAFIQFPRNAAQTEAESVTGLASQWKERDGFQYNWPTVSETFDEAWEADIADGDRKIHFVIAFTDRVSAGELRRRAVVFEGYHPRLTPLVEFVGANDFETTQRMASVIKSDSGKHVRAREALPTEYQQLPVVLFSDVVVGPYAANSLAVLAGARDLDLMAQHGVIRARYKGFI